MSRPWSADDIERFVIWTGCRQARDLARDLKRTTFAVQSMRRKLLRLRRLSPRLDQLDLIRLLSVSERFIMSHSLAEIFKRSREKRVPVKRFLRRSRWYRKPHLVGPYKRNPPEGVSS